MNFIVLRLEFSINQLTLQREEFTVLFCRRTIFERFAIS